MNEIIIKQSFSKQLKLTILAVLMTGVSIFVLMHNKIFYKIIGITGTFFFGFCLIVIFVRLVNPRAVLIINEKGFTDNCASFSFSNIGFIPWESVNKIYISSLLTQKYISVEINGIEKYLSSKYHKIMINTNSALGYPGVTISLNSTDEKCENVIKIMQEYLDTYRTKQTFYS